MQNTCTADGGKGRNRIMVVANRYNTVITRARISRTAKEKSVAVKRGSVSTTSRTGGSFASKNTVTQLLLQQLTGKNSTSVTAEKMAEYQSRIYDYGVVNVAAERVGKQLGKLMQTGEGSLFAAAEESGDYSEIEKEISSFVGDYNLMLRKLQESGNSADAAYAKQLKSDMNKNYTALKEIGITSDANGILTFDQKVFAEADKGKLKDLFGPSSTLAAGLKKLAGNIESFTLSQQKELQEKMYKGSSNYNQSGLSDYYEWMTGSSYNAKG